MKRYNCICSSADASMVEQICKDKRIEVSWFLFLFSTVKYQSRKKSLQFITLKEMWKYGLVIKRYMEYPDVSIDEVTNVFEEIQTYLRQEDYVVHFIDENLESDRINLILNISLADRKVTFRSWSITDVMQEDCLSYEEYFREYMVLDSARNVVRFDIYQPVEQKGRQVAELSLLQKRIEMGRITGMDKLHCLLNANQTNRSFMVMNEWFSVFEKLVSWLQSEKNLKTDIVFSEEERKLFGTGNAARHLNQMIKVYNKLLERLKNIL